MNRRNFFKAVTGFVIGVCAVFVPKAKAKELSESSSNGGGSSSPSISISPTEESEIKTFSAKDWVDAQFNPVKELQLNEPFKGKVVGMCKFGNDLWIVTERGVSRVKGISV